MYRLFIDESGKNSFNNLKDSREVHHFIGGVIVDDHTDKIFLRTRGDQIKFKYWGRTDVTFRGTNMRGLSGPDFIEFRDEYEPISGEIIIDNSIKRDNFCTDFHDYIKESKFKFACIGVNKLNWIERNPLISHAIAKRWNDTVTSFEKKLTRAILEELVCSFLCFLKNENTSGQIIVEASDTRQDTDILSIYGSYMYNGMPSMGLSSLDVRELLTCISFVTKKNLDIETQMADIGTHFMQAKARSDDGLDNSMRPLTDFDRAIITAYEEKAFLNVCNAMQPNSVRRI